MTKQPVLRVISGNPTDDEIAAVLAVVSKKQRVKELAEPTKMSLWGDPRQHMRHVLPVGTHAWRKSGWAQL